jgi:hypothetical protein
MLRIIVILIVLARLSPAFAVAPSEATINCIPMEEAQEKLNAFSPLKHLIELHDKELSWARQFFGLTPDLPWAQRMAVAIHENGKIGVILGRGNEVCLMAILKEDSVPEFFKAIQGEKS